LYGTAPLLAWAEEAGIPIEDIGMVARLLRINMFVEQLLEEIVEPHGISVSDSMVLANMRRGTTSPVGLCRILNRTTGGMSLTIEIGRASCRARDNTAKDAGRGRERTAN